MKLPILTTLLVCFLITEAIAAQESEKQHLAKLPFVPASVESLTHVRLSKIVNSEDYLELKRVVGDDLEKVLDRFATQYLKFSLAKFEELESLINITWRTENEHKGKKYRRFNRAMLINTIDNQQDKFDLATHAVKEELPYKDKSILVLKYPLDRYTHACILSPKTIAWSTHRDSIENLIDAGTTGPAKSKWYKQWQSQADKSFSICAKLKQETVYGAPSPFAKELKGVEFAFTGIELAKTIRVEILGVCESHAKATKIVELAPELTQKLKSQMKSPLYGGYVNQIVQSKKIDELFDNMKFDADKEIARAVGSLKLDFNKLAEPIKDLYKFQSRQFASNNARQHSLAFLNFESAFRHFPQSVYNQKDGKPSKPYSWRIAILPFIGRQDIYDQYDFDQEWDSPHNQKVTSQMPEVFRSDMDDTDTTNASFFLLAGPGGMFGGEEPLTLSQMTDGTSNTVLAIEAKRDVHWAKPEDILIDPNLPLPEFGGFHEGGFNIARVDGSVEFLPENVSHDYLRKLFSPNDGLVVGPITFEPTDEELEQNEDR